MLGDVAQNIADINQTGERVGGDDTLVLSAMVLHRVGSRSVRVRRDSSTSLLAKPDGLGLGIVRLLGKAATGLGVLNEAFEQTSHALSALYLVSTRIPIMGTSQTHTVATSPFAIAVTAIELLSVDCPKVNARVIGEKYAQLTVLLVDTDLWNFLGFSLTGIPVHGFLETWLTAVKTRALEGVSKRLGCL